MIFLTAIAVAGGLKELTNETSGIQGTLEGSGAARSWGEQGHTQEPVPALLDVSEPARVEEVVSAPPVSPQPAEVLPEPDVVPVATAVPPIPQPGIEAAICSLPWECGIALRVAACESGPDYTAGFNSSGHAGTFQISPIHAWRFAERGLDFWRDALVLEWNLDVAYEIYKERWWWAWSCYP